jgi:hypothetical protein
LVDQDYEADLSILEDMCSELEENAILLDKDLNIIWLNKVLRNKLSSIFLINGDNSINSSIRFGIDEPIDYMLVKRLCADLFGKELFSENSTAKEVFNTGKLAKSLTHAKSGTIKKISIPIKFGNSVAYVLEIIEEPIQYNNPEIIAIIQYFLGQYKIPCIVADKEHHFICHNKIIDELFKNSGLLKEMIYSKLRNNPQKGLEDLKELMYLSHVVKKRILKDGKKVVAYIYELHKN